MGPTLLVGRIIQRPNCRQFQCMSGCLAQCEGRDSSSSAPSQPDCPYLGRTPGIAAKLGSSTPTPSCLPEVKGPTSLEFLIGHLTRNICQFLFAWGGTYFFKVLCHQTRDYEMLAEAPAR